MTSSTVCARDLMSSRLVTVSHDDSLKLAFQIMNEERIRHLPVRSSTGEVIGIISDRDLQRAMTPQNSLEVPDEFEVQFSKGARVSDYMSWPVRRVAPDLPITGVVRELLQHKISAVLVGSPHSQHQGIITSEDLLELLLVQLKRSDPALKADTNT